MNPVMVSCREIRFNIEKNQLLNTNDVAAAFCFGAKLHLPLSSELSKLEPFDCLIATMSKQILPCDGGVWMRLLREFKERWPEKKVILHQEGEAEFYLKRDSTQWNIQRDWITTIKDKVDLLLAHNARDAALYRYFVDEGEVEAWRTVQDIDKITPYVIPPDEKVEKFTGISTYDGRAGGMVGMAVARLTSDKITQITRSIYNDDREDVMCMRFGVWPNVTRHGDWHDWLKQITKIYLYLHPMPAASAGRDTIACATLGIPVVGNKHLDAQMHLFPDLAVDVYDARSMEQLVRDLLYDHAFYDRVREKAMKGVKFYNIERGRERANKIMQRLGWK